MRTQRITRKSAHVPGWNLSGNEPGASCDGDSGPQGAHNNPKPGNHPELTVQRTQPASPRR
jgi:hypothetical protein